MLAQLHLGSGASDTSVAGAAGGARWGHEAIGVMALGSERPRADWNWMRRKWIGKVFVLLPVPVAAVRTLRYLAILLVA